MGEVYPALARAMEGEVAAGREGALEDLAGYVAACLARGESARLVFVCTHNSRRSHMAHLWARAAAMRAGLDGVLTYSGGTEATALHPNAAAALERAGFSLERLDGSTNPRYQVRCGEDDPGIVCFSKRHDDEANPREGFAAVMVCGEADEACPVIAGERFAIRYEDPKVGDGTDRERLAYDERSRQIAREMGFVMRAVRATLEAD